MVEAFTDARALAKAIPEDARCVLLGECTHGTEEFYRIRAEVTKWLITNRGFKICFCEADWPFMWHVDEYAHRRRLRMYPQGTRFPEWMWQNRAFMELVEWLRARQQSDVHVFGMDCYSKDESLAELLRFLDIHDPTLATRVRFASPEEWPTLLSRLQWKGENGGGGAQTAASSAGGGPPAPPPCSKLEQFSAEQNLECMIAAEEYYAKQRLEPPGSQASWNARDQHMVTTLLRVKELLDDPKIIVWAHNSHVGDSTATPTGGIDFERNNTWNLGQMCRAVLDGVHIVGLYSYTGEVRAASSWGGADRVMRLLPALPNSFEARMHELLARQPSKPTQAFVRCTGLGGGSGGAAAMATSSTASTAADDVQAALGVGAPGTHTEYPVGQKFCMLHAQVHCTEGPGEKSREVSMPKLGTFEALERTKTEKGVWRLRCAAGWVTEFTPHRRVTVHCLPANHPQLAFAASGALDDAKGVQAALLQAPLLQRWVGVQYHPDTEMSSHYGEVVMGRCYDTVVFVDTTSALSTDIETPLPIEAGAGSGGHASEGAPVQNRRLMKEYLKLMKNPAPNVHAHPLENNILEWHFVITGSQEPYLHGKYHGILEFPPDFPMKPPSIRMLTPSGRFETNTRICMTMSDFHAESWNPAWTVQAILIGVQSFMYEESNGSIGSVLDSAENRRRFAQQSLGFNMRNEIYVELFCGEDGARNPKKKKKKKARKEEGEEDGTGSEAEDEPVCRFCHNGGDLVEPCACKGSSQFVHLSCLQQWQKSVLLTQSTHPKYQTKIDEYCNVCNTKFKFQGKSRREQILEYTGTELAQRIRNGNLIISSRHSSERNKEAMARHPEITDDVAHWTESVFLIVAGGTAASRDGVMAVNISRSLPRGPVAKLNLGRMHRHLGLGSSAASPAAIWAAEFQPAVESLDCIASVQHFIGGPVQPDEPHALIEIPHSSPGAEGGTKPRASFMSRSRSLTSTSQLAESPQFRRCCVKRAEPGDLFFANVNDVLLLASKRWEIAHEKSHIKVFWGYAAWGATQLLAELARRSWGLSEQWDERGGFEGMHTGKYDWEDTVDHMSIAKASEYSREE